MTQNQIAYHNVQETIRHNKMMEQETNRHQLAEEAIKQRANAIQAVANYVSAVHYKNMDTESVRSHLAEEYLTRANLAETSRHNKATEALTRSLNNSLIRRNLAEASYATENTKYIQERAKTQAEETRRAGYEADIIGVKASWAPQQEAAATRQAKAEASVAQRRAELLDEQARIQWTYGLKNFTGSIHDVASSVQIVVGSAGEIFGKLFGAEGWSTLQKQNTDWYNSLQPSSGQTDALQQYMDGKIDVETFLGQ